MNPAVRAGIEIAAVAAAVIAVTFVVLVRMFWRKDKPMQEP
jgi:hypothetical protein